VRNQLVVEGKVFAEAGAPLGQRRAEGKEGGRVEVER
jgi:hypothetical protein